METSRQNEKGRFIKGANGRKYEKICTQCANNYEGFSTQTTCEACFPACLQCGITITHRHRKGRKFCSGSCRSKWNYVHSCKVQEHFESIRQLSQTPEIRAKIKNSNTGVPRPNSRGANNPNWRGGTYGSIRHTIMGRAEYINWRKSVFERDNFTCQICNTRGGELNADHYPVPFKNLLNELKLEAGESKKHVVAASVKFEKLWDIDNGRTLCLKCHRKQPTSNNGPLSI